MQIKILTTPPVTINRQGLCIGLFSDERPPCGCAGLVDWRMNGMISKEIASGRITGVFRDNVLLDTSDRLPLAKVLLAGLGPLADISHDRLYQAGRHMAQTMRDILCREYVVAIPGAGRCNLAATDIAEAMIAGFFDFLSASEDGALPSICFFIEDGNMEGYLAGFARFQDRAGDVSNSAVFEVKISPTVLEDF